MPDLSKYDNSDRRPDEAYLAEVDGCDIYIGLFGNDYGYEDTSIRPAVNSSAAVSAASPT
jgi:hypothetical protein